MTIKEISKQLYSLSVGGFFNRQKFTQNQFTNYLETMMQGTERIYLEIALPDGWWQFSVSQFSNDEYGYYIPETREQEQGLIAEFKKSIRENRHKAGLKE